MEKHTHSPLQKIIGTGLLVMLLSIAAFAVPTLLTTNVLIQNNAIVTAGQLSVTLTACDTVNGNTFTSTGREVLILQNTDSSPHNITITPVADPYGGTNTSLTAYSLPASTTSAIQMKYQIGWISGSVITIPACSSNLIKIAVLQTN